jgi:hypothetical protein
MRTHLLRTTYPAPAEVEPDTGIACNDDCYWIATTLVSVPPDKQSADKGTTRTNRMDDYELGGYAGI